MGSETSPAKIPVAVMGATGTVGRRFISLLQNHPWFAVTAVAASAKSAGMSYREAVGHRMEQDSQINNHIGRLIVRNAETDIDNITNDAAIVFSAVDMPKDAVRNLENSFAAAGAAVVSNNSAHRWTPDVPMVIPEINPHHLELISIQRKLRGWSTGLITVKPNCSIQSYVPVLEALKPFSPEKVIVSTYQAVSGAGRTLASWPEMQDNVNPHIGGEEEKSEKEPLRVWGTIENDRIEPASQPEISSNCIRVPVSEGHLAAVNVSFKKKPNREELLAAIRNFKNPVADFNLPSSPEEFLIYLDDADRPQTALDRDRGSGMSITVGRLRPDNVLDWKFVALSHNTLRGAAGGGVLTAELLVQTGYVTRK